MQGQNLCRNLVTWYLTELINIKILEINLVVIDFLCVCNYLDLDSIDSAVFLQHLDSLWFSAAESAVIVPEVFPENSQSGTCNTGTFALITNTLFQLMFSH